MIITTFRTKIYLAFIFLLLPAISMAGAFPSEINSGVSSKTAADTQHQKPQPLTQEDALAFMQDLNLDTDQQSKLTSILKKQMPSIFSNIQSLDDAHAVLRNMALAKQYDEGMVNALAETIANSSANLAVLQAAREYQIFAMLTPEQAKLYEKLKRKTSVDSTQQ